MAATGHPTMVMKGCFEFVGGIGSRDSGANNAITDVEAFAATLKLNVFSLSCELLFCFATWCRNLSCPLLDMSFDGW